MTAMPVRGTVLKWAREIRRVSIETAAEKIGWDVSRLKTAEGEDASLDEDDLTKIARAYRLPVATLLMPEPLPVERYGPRPIVDNRIHQDGVNRPGVETLQYVENGWELLDLMVEIGETTRLPLFKRSDRAEAAAAAERSRLGITVAEQLAWRNERTAYLTWRIRLEDEGIVVHALNIKEESIRGFALQNDGACLIAINKNESADRAKVYSLIHEYAHLLLRQGGLSDHNRSVPVEKWCNTFAACFLLPAEDVRAFCLRAGFRGELGNYHVGRVATAFKVSNATVALRFEELGLAPEGLYQRLKAGWQKPRKKGGFDPEGDHVKTELNRYGTRHVSLVLNALRDGRIDPVEARYALDVNPQYHGAILNAAHERQRAYGKTKPG